ncbi:PhoX family protein [Amphibiibacter pelophylacis]|uniref:DUF839 domain-containing protein n=1 Tax=Amphibiibacter pelophylacis TaxID=1799477 RepID=A0ACC6P3H4_9BURK
MTPSHDASRRLLLKGLFSAPLLPLTTSAAASALLAACGGGDGRSPVQSVRFIGMAAPSLANPAAMATTSVGSSLELRYADGSTRTQKLAYHAFFTTGDSVSDGQGGQVVAGGYFNISNQPILDTSVPGQTRQFFSDCPDGTSLLTVPGAQVAGVSGNPVFAVVQFEYTTRNLAGESEYGMLPSPIAVLTLDQNPATGELRLVKYSNVDTSSVNGLWITCGASLSPWGTHLSSEEYEPDATQASNAQLRGFSQNLYGDPAKANPYHYGHMPEVTVQPDGTGRISKHYCMGRISHELVQVMPDERTVLMGDDATSGGYFMFIADTARDLSAGTLYVAQLTAPLVSVDPAAAPTALKWIRLGHATSAEIRALVDGGITAADIMDVRTSDPGDARFTRITVSGRRNWVQLKTGMEKAAAFLETHRYAALVGGSLGFSKMEGTTVNIADKVMYSALSYCKDSMVATSSRHDDASRVSLSAALNAGAVMALPLDSGQADTSGLAIESSWVPVRLQALITGVDLASADDLGNLADASRIANPDNLKFSGKMRTLFIGEDSGLHVNNFLWAYNVDTKELARLLSVPAGAESTGLQAVDEINGWTYIMSNFQHPGDWESPLHDKVKPVLDPLVRASYRDRFGAAVGYLTSDGGLQL